MTNIVGWSERQLRLILAVLARERVARGALLVAGYVLLDEEPRFTKAYVR